MALVKTIGPYEFRFYSQGETGEPPHIHMRPERLEAKFWLMPTVQLALPLEVVSQLSHVEQLPAEAEVVVLRCPPQIDHVHGTDSALNVYLKDGRILSSPLAWFPRLMHGTPAERNHYRLQGDDDVIHWPDLDEDIDLLGLFQGGKSAESESPIQRWLQTRVATPAL